MVDASIVPCEERNSFQFTFRLSVLMSDSRMKHSPEAGSITSNSALSALTEEGNCFISRMKVSTLFPLPFFFFFSVCTFNVNPRLVAVRSKLVNWPFESSFDGEPGFLKWVTIELSRLFFFFSPNALSINWTLVPESEITVTTTGLVPTESTEPELPVGEDFLSIDVEGIGYSFSVTRSIQSEYRLIAHLNG
ncbi:hypothetical protein PMAYCL1PPCAC_18198, partial [Pristionchus mayeri]